MEAWVAATYLRKEEVEEAYLRSSNHDYKRFASDCKEKNIFYFIKR